MIKTKQLLVLLLLLATSTLKTFSNDVEFGIKAGFYNELLLKPGITLAPEIKLPVTDSGSFIFSIPNINYFYFPGTSQAFSILPGIQYNMQPGEHFYFGLVTSTGVSFKNYTAEIYDRYGNLSSKTWEIQSITMAGLTFGTGHDKYDLEFNIGWKGLYPYNLGLQHQPYLQFSYRSYIK